MKKVLIVTLYYFLGLIAFSFGVSTYEAISINKIISDFKKEAILVSEEKTRKYYEVTNYNYHPNRLLFSDNDSSKQYIGSKGDIILSRDTEIGVPLLDLFGYYYTGGHAVILDEQGYLYESIWDRNVNYLDNALFPKGQKAGENFSIARAKNYFLNSNYRSSGDEFYDKFGSYYRHELIGLRVKKADDMIIDKALEHAFNIYDQLEPPYKSTFFVGPNDRYYCSSFVTAVYEMAFNDYGNNDFKIDGDGFTVMINDIILSKEMYIAYYIYIENGIENIYYLK